VAGKIPNDLRSQIASAFRERICERLEVAPFLHQRTVWAALDGLELTGELADSRGSGLSVRVDKDGPILYAATKPRVVKVGNPELIPHFGEVYTGPARFCSDLGAFKVGKSFGGALWASGFAAVPGAKVSLVGLEYNICEPEFTYISEFLLSGRGMNLKAKSFVNRPRQGDMYLELENGAVFECRSWERKDSLKGKENDVYLYCEAYQLPGFECFSSFSQNLRAREGYAYFATTPDRPWIKQLHELGHGYDPQWHCTCSVGAESNPFTFDAVAKERDKKLMTREKYEIHYNGQLGDFVGRVFNYSRGQRIFDRGSHPELFAASVSADSAGNRELLRIPDGWTVEGGCDTGTFYTALLVAFSPDGEAFVLDEFPNYRYLAGEAERDEQLAIPQWARRVSERSLQLGGRTGFWADANSQFKGELKNYGIHLLPARVPVEARTEITREYFEHGRIWLAPWLDILPFELENAAWPEEASLSGKFARIKDRDHTLDCLEHLLARRPFGRARRKVAGDGSWASSAGLKRKIEPGNRHLGRF
jgi:hypothetical protein